MDERSERCPTCNGEGGANALLRYDDGRCREQWMPCSACRGAGTVSERRAAVTRAGEALGERRRALDLSLRELAAKLGISASNLSDVEHGRAPESAMEEVRAGLAKLEAEAPHAD